MFCQPKIEIVHAIVSPVAQFKSSKELWSTGHRAQAQYLDGWLDECLVCRQARPAGQRVRRGRGYLVRAMLAAPWDRVWDEMIPRSEEDTAPH